MLMKSVLEVGIFLISFLNIINGDKSGVKTVDHTYYEMAVFQDDADGMYSKYHVDMTNSVKHDFLSTHSQAAEAVEPEFKFPFYGHMMNKFFITTHGFLSFAPRLHNLMYKTQYIAPLRVKLDPASSNFSSVNYLSSSESLTIQWTNITVAEPFQHPLGGRFTFQVTLFNSGDIVFVYVNIPALLTADALYDNEPVAGLSDAFLLGNNELHVYHTANVDNPDINSKTVVYFKAKPTCIAQKSCQACSAFRENSEFSCSWCSELNTCSDGADRLRENWVAIGCGISNITSIAQCNMNSQAIEDLSNHIEWRTSALNEDEKISNESGLSSAGLISSIVSAVCVVLLLIIGLGFIYIYGRRNPGGVAEMISRKLDKTYERFDEESPKKASKKEQMMNNNNNNNDEIIH